MAQWGREKAGFGVQKAQPGRPAGPYLPCGSAPPWPRLLRARTSAVPPPPPPGGRKRLGCAPGVGARGSLSLFPPPARAGDAGPGSAPSPAAGERGGGGLRVHPAGSGPPWCPGERCCGGGCWGSAGSSASSSGSPSSTSSAAPSSRSVPSPEPSAGRAGPVREIPYPRIAFVL